MDSTLQNKASGSQYTVPNKFQLLAPSVLITRRGNIDLSDFQQKQRTNAAWIIASMGVSKIREFWASDYPCQFLIITEDDEVYDITTFSAYTVDSLSMIVPIRRKAMLSEDAED